MFAELSKGSAVEKRLYPIDWKVSQKIPKPARTEVLPFLKGSHARPTRGATFFQRLSIISRGQPASPLPNPLPSGPPGKSIPGGAGGYNWARVVKVGSKQIRPVA